MMEPDKEIKIDNSEYDYENMDNKTRLRILENQMFLAMTNFKILGNILKDLAEEMTHLQSSVHDLKSESLPQSDEHFK